MNSSEQVSEEKNLEEREEGLAHGEITPKNRLENQIRLADEIYKIQKKTDPIDTEEGRNEIMNHWIDSGYSESYRNLEDSEYLKNNPRLKGDIYKITAQDVMDFKEGRDLAA